MFIKAQSLVTVFNSFILAFALGVNGLDIQTSQVPLIPRSVLCSSAEKSRISISPDGKKVAYLAEAEGLPALWLKTIGTDDDHAIACTMSDIGIYDYAWSPDSTMLVYISPEEKICSEELCDNASSICIYSVHVDSHEKKTLACFINVMPQIIYAGKKRPHDILIELHDDDPEQSGLYALNCTSGDISLIHAEYRRVQHYFINNQGEVHGKYITHDSGYDLWIKDNKNDPWTLVFSLDDSDESDKVQVLGVSSDGNDIYMLDSRFSNTKQLVKLDSSTKKSTVIFNDSGYDTVGAVLDNSTNEPQIVIVERAQPDMIALDPALESAIKKIKNITQAPFTIRSRSYDDKHWLIAVLSDTIPCYYVYDREASTMTFLFDLMPALRKYTLASTQAFTITARDGLKLEGYVTYPVGVERNKLPMVLMVHGGPYSRDTWGCDLDVQWLANRGYMCVQVNFRGSTGYGKDFVRASIKEWGAAMHNDLIDTVNYFVDYGIADSQKIAIYGKSYGGYAALCGAAFTPNIFRCAIDVVGPSNLINFVQSYSTTFPAAQKHAVNMIGDPVTEKDLLKSRSPFFSVENIKIPILIAHGGQDQRVKQEEVEQFVDALKKHAVPHEYLLFPDEGHGIAGMENLMDFYAHVEKFLADTLGGRYQN